MTKILRYAAGFEIRCTSRKIGTICHPFKIQMLKILEELKDDNSKDKYKSVIDKINGGGVVFIDDETFLLVLVIGYATRSSLSALMGRYPPHNLDKDVVTQMCSSTSTT